MLLLAIHLVLQLRLLNEQQILLSMFLMTEKKSICKYEVSGEKKEENIYI